MTTKITNCTLNSLMNNKCYICINPGVTPIKKYIQISNSMIRHLTDDSYIRNYYRSKMVMVFPSKDSYGIMIKDYKSEVCYDISEEQYKNLVIYFASHVIESAFYVEKEFI